MKRFIASLSMLIMLGTISTTQAFVLVGGGDFSGPDYSNYYADTVISVLLGNKMEATTAAENTDETFPWGKTSTSGMFIGSDEAFDGVSMDVATSASGGSYIVTYYDGSTWSTLVSASTADIKNSSSEGVFRITWDRPSDWTKRTVEMRTEGGRDGASDDLYFVKIMTEDAYNNAAEIEQVGILDYNLIVDLKTELNEDLNNHEDEISLSSSADETIYATDEMSGGKHAFALYTGTGTSAKNYTYTVNIEGYVESSDTISVDRSQNTAAVTLNYTHKITGKDADGNKVSVDSAKAGSKDTTCEIKNDIAYCPVPTDEDGDTVTLYADGYAPGTGSIANRTNEDDAQASTSTYLEYAYVANIKDGSTKISGATVKMGDAYDILCEEFATGQYGCVVPTDEAAKIKVVKTGYDTYTDTFDTTRDSNTDAQETQSFDITGTPSTTDDINLTVDDLYLSSDDLKITVANEGDKDVSNSADVYLYVYVDGARELSDTIDPTYLEANEDLTITALSNYFDAQDETYKIKVCIDAKDDVDESDEDDNCRTETLNTSGSSTGTPDFDVTDIYLDSEENLKFVVENIGDEDVSGSIDLEVSVNGDVVWTKTVFSTNSAYDFFDAGADTTFDLEDLLANEGSKYEVEVCVDTGDDVDEEKESNNCMTVDEDSISIESCGNFTDLDQHWSMGYVCDLYNRDVVKGRTSTRYYPDLGVTRAEFLKMVLLGFEMDPYAVTTVHYSDVSSGSWYYTYVTYATAQGIVDGYDDGTFLPNEYINRAEAVVMLMRAAEQEDNHFDSSDIDYSDVDVNDWFAEAVVIASDHQIVKGYSNNTFKPQNTITRGEAAKIVDLGYQEFIQ